MHLEQVDLLRQQVAKATTQSHKSAFGQFMTPAPIARFMASLFPKEGRIRAAKLLDAGAGVGSLTSAFLDRYLAGGIKLDSVDVTAFEIDPKMVVHLDKVLTSYARDKAVSCRVKTGDFIEHGVTAVQFRTQSFTHAILNPPYKKIGTASRPRRLISQIGIETSNLYAAFVALSVELLEKDGVIVAIIPRSFCNGPYFRPFRNFLLSSARIEHMHLFDSRNSAFREDDVLQENLIIRLRKGVPQGDVIVSTSSNDNFIDYTERTYRANEIVFPGDTERFIHVPTGGDSNLDIATVFKCSLTDLNISISTGPVVDFRLKEHLRAMPEDGSVPLLYANHFGVATEVTWPLVGSKKPNAIMPTAESQKWLIPNGFYTVTRRFTSKEERRRVVAYVVDPEVFPDAKHLGLENHLNFFHRRKAGLPEALARGLAVYLNSTAVEECFRRFNGHTQVNATDLRQIKYPCETELIELGQWAISQSSVSQSLIDEGLRTIL